MSQEHKGLPVAGYLPQSNDKVALVNVNKELEERCLRRIEWFQNENKKARDEYSDNLLKALSGKPDKKLTLEVPYDEVMLIEAKKQIKQAFMWFNRAVFQPARVSLPEDKETQND